MMAMTNKELEAALKAEGVEVPAKARKAELEALWGAVGAVRTVNVPRLNVREKPSKNAAVLRVAEIGDELRIADEADGWCRIAGGGGYVMAQFVEGVSDCYDTGKSSH